jgi:hypothetical protein
LSRTFNIDAIIAGTDDIIAGKDIVMAATVAGTITTGIGAAAAGTAGGIVAGACADGGGGRSKAVGKVAVLRSFGSQDASLLLCSAQH